MHLQRRKKKTNDEINVRNFWQHIFHAGATHLRWRSHS